MEQQISTIVTSLLKAAGIDHSVASESAGGQMVFQIRTRDSRGLIGPRGETLRALDYLVKKIAEKQGLSEASFIVDVDGYHVKRISELEQKARMMAGRARSFQYDVELTPMSAYERLIIHSALSSEPNIKTESRGEGRDRRVVIKYIA